MVVGDCEEDFILENTLDINIIPVPYNSFDLTGLIYVAENHEKFLDSHYFLLHDTCLVGPNFKKLAENIRLNDPIKTLREGISMNIGMYSLQTLIENSNSLDKLNNILRKLIKNICENKSIKIRENTKLFIINMFYLNTFDDVINI
jgi:hypothetical protein